MASTSTILQVKTNENQEKLRQILLSLYFLFFFYFLLHAFKQRHLFIIVDLKLVSQERKLMKQQPK